MTTENSPAGGAGTVRGRPTSHRGRRIGASRTIGGILVRTVAVCALVGLLVAGIGWAVEGAAAAWSVLLGTALVTVVFSGGAAAVNVVSGLMPEAALMIALLTYFLQVLVVLVALAALTDSAVLEERLDRGWVAGSVIGATLIWMAGQVAVTVRARIPIFDLPDRGADDHGARR